jgi:hypothetical protein
VPLATRMPTLRATSSRTPRALPKAMPDVGAHRPVRLARAVNQEFTIVSFRQRLNGSPVKVGPTGSAHARQRHHIAGGGSALDCCKDVSGPGIERGALLCRPIMALIDANDPGATAADMVQHRFGDFEPHAETLQAGGKRSARAVQDLQGVAQSDA